jgi:hypothetical protein
MIFVKEIYLLPPTRGLKSRREGCTVGKHRVIKTGISWIK